MRTDEQLARLLWLLSRGRTMYILNKKNIRNFLGINSRYILKGF